MSHPNEKPILAVDIVLYALDYEIDKEKVKKLNPKVLLIQRKYEPFKGQWAFPGGHVEKNESLDDAALRELQEETSVTGIKLRQFGAFGDPGRDPRGWCVSVGYWAVIKSSQIHVEAADDAADAKWFSVDNLPELAFDHKKIFEKLQSELVM